MAGEIHGLISREHAWRMWGSFGERVALEGSLDPSNITPFEAVQVAWGADSETQGRIYNFYRNADNRQYWLKGLPDKITQDPDPKLIDLLWESNEKQRKLAEQERQKAIEEGLAFVGLLSTAMTSLIQEDVLTPSEVKSTQEWMIGPDDLPYMQHTPMSQLEYARSGVKYDNETPDLMYTDCTDFSLGIIRSALNLQGGSLDKKKRIYNKLHESIHANCSGVEIYDITREDGWRHPEATVISHFAYEPTVKICAGDDFSKVENAEVAEGWDDFITRELIRVEPRLGHPLGNAHGYPWAETNGRIKKDRPKLFRAITKAALVEATPNNPHAKREALADLHAYADNVLGQPNVLNELFVSNGGSLLDIFTKGKAKAAIKQ